MVRTLLGQKKDMRQVWTAEGRRLPVTAISLAGNAVVRVVSAEEGEQKVQVGFGSKKLKNMNNAQRQQLAKAGIEAGKRWFTETKTENELQAGQNLLAQEVFQVGDLIKVSGNIKGRGFAGVIKRYGFHGGPRTHGQSDRARAPGSAGGGTTPGHIFRGKRMPGHYGGDVETLENRVIVAIDSETQTLWIKGTLPGSYNGLLRLEKQDGQAAIELPIESLALLGVSPVVEEPVVAESEASESTESGEEQA